MNHNDKQFMAEKIRTQYVERQPSELDTLRALDRRVKRPANAFAYTLGSIGAVVMGTGMSLVMTDIAAQLGLGDMTVPGIVIGIVGMVLALVNYPIYQSILKSRRKKYAPEILAISERIISE